MCRHSADRVRITPFGRNNMELGDWQRLAETGTVNTDQITLFTIKFQELLENISFLLTVSTSPYNLIASHHGGRRSYRGGAYYL